LDMLHFFVVISRTSQTVKHGTGQNDSGQTCR